MVKNVVRLVFLLYITTIKKSIIYQQKEKYLYIRKELKI